MISIDTNVLLRHVLQDDNIQSPKASQLISISDKILITDVVLIESVWTLCGKRYKSSTDDIVTFISNLFSEPAIYFENSQTVWAALNHFQNCHRKEQATKSNKLPDFPDALIITKAKLLAKEWNETLDAVYSFDKGVLKISGARHP